MSASAPPRSISTSRGPVSRVEAVAGYQGPARVAAYTVAYPQMEPVKCIIIADTPSGKLCMASSHDAALARQATREELIGTTVRIDRTLFEQ